MKVGVQADVEEEDLEALYVALRELGHEPGEPDLYELTESVSKDLLVVALTIGAIVGKKTIDELVDAFFGWVRSRRINRRRRVIGRILGPDGKPVREVEIPPED